MIHDQVSTNAPYKRSRRRYGIKSCSAKITRYVKAFSVRELMDRTLIVPWKGDVSRFQVQSAHRRAYAV